jgi:hypothetical protein
MMELLHATDIRLGLVTNGEHWMLVDAPRGNTTGFASWYATLWFEEPLNCVPPSAAALLRRTAPAWSAPPPARWPTTRSKNCGMRSAR